MKKILFLSSLLISAFMATAQNTVFLTVNGNTRSVTLEDNTATTALKELLMQGPITITMSDYGGFEKVGALPESLPTENSQITTHPGDIMLYQGNQMVIFYGSNSWSYTPLGKIDNVTAAEVKEFLGNGIVEVTISLDMITGIADISADRCFNGTVYDLSGRIVENRPLAPGIYIANRKKIIIR